MAYQSVEQLVDESAAKAGLLQLSKTGNEFSFYCLNFTDSSNLRGSDRSLVNDKLLVGVANLVLSLMGKRIIIAKTNKDRLELVLPNLGKAQAVESAGQLREQIEKNFCSKMPGLGLAIGLASHPTDTDEKHNDLRHLAILGADEATKLGMNRIFAAISAADRANGK